MIGKGIREDAFRTDFNECVSKDNLQKLIQNERTFIDGKLNDIMQTINTLVK